MKKLPRAGELMWVMGIVIVAFGIALCDKADLGVSMIAAPAFIVNEAVSAYLPGLTVGMTEYIIQGLLLALMCIIIGRFRLRYLLAFGVSVIYGSVLDLFLWLLSGVTLDAVWLRWVMLILGDAVTAFGVACFFRTYLPLQVYELFVAEFAARYKLAVNNVKWGFDLSMLAISIVLALSLFGDAAAFDWSSIGYASFHSIGLGTLVTAAINSPIIRILGNLIDRIFDTSPRFPRLKAALLRKG